MRPFKEPQSCFVKFDTYRNFEDEEKDGSEAVSYRKIDQEKLHVSRVMSGR